MVKKDRKIKFFTPTLGSKNLFTRMDEMVRIAKRNPNPATDTNNQFLHLDNFFTSKKSILLYCGLAVNRNRIKDEISSRL